jgi:hypothetical protein
VEAQAGGLEESGDRFVHPPKRRATHRQGQEGEGVKYQHAPVRRDTALYSRRLIYSSQAR